MELCMGVAPLFRWWILSFQSVGRALPTWHQRSELQQSLGPFSDRPFSCPPPASPQKLLTSGLSLKLWAHWVPLGLLFISLWFL